MQSVNFDFTAQCNKSFLLITSSWVNKSPKCQIYICLFFQQSGLKVDSFAEIWQNCQISVYFAWNLTYVGYQDALCVILNIFTDDAIKALHIAILI